MTRTVKFDEQTHWDHDPGGLRAGGSGWAPPGGDNFIDIADPYWGAVLEDAQRAYGDPGMHFNTDSVGAERLLVFGDGTAVPRDGSLAYRDTANSTTYLLNDDGTVTPLHSNGAAGQPITPGSFRRTADGAYAPVDASGNQIAPLSNSLPPAPNGYHDQGGTLTPKNARGEYYVDDPASGKRTYFDSAGRPLTDPPAGPPLATDEQQSGRAADAVKKLHEELQNRHSHIADSEGRLSEVLLRAHATTADGQQKLQAVQQTIVAAIDDPDLGLGTPAGEQAFLTLLRGQVAAITDVVKSGTLSADEQAETLDALSVLYGTDSASTPAPPATSAAEVPVAPPVPADVDPTPEEPIPDPTLSDLGVGRVGMGQTTDPWSALTSALPAAMGAIGPGTLGGGLGMDPLASLAAAGAPLAGLASQLRDLPRRDDSPDAATSDRSTDDHPDTSDDAGESEHRAPHPEGAAAPPAEPQPSGTPGDGAPPAAPAAAPAPAPSTTVSLPDGSTATAKTAALAGAVTSYLGGSAVDAAYRGAGIELPPPGTPVTEPVDPSALSCGSIGMFKDHYVVALSPVKGLQNGQVVPLSAVASGPDFLGWMDPVAARAPMSADSPGP